MSNWIRVVACAAFLALPMLEARAADYTLRLNHTLPATHLRERDAELFKGMVEKATGGRVEVQIFPAGQLYKSDQDAIKAVRSGAIEGAMVTTGDLALFVPAFNLYEAPFVITSYAQLDALLDSPVAAEILAKLEPLGIKGLVHTDAGSAILASRPHPISTPGDLRGLRVRAAAGRVQVRALELLGASAIQLPVADIGPALERGTVEGVLSTPSALAEMQIGSLVPYGTVTNQQFFPPVVIVNLAWWNGLPPEVRQQVSGTLKSFEQQAREANLKEEERAFGSLASQGVKVVKLDAAALDAFKSKLQPLHEEIRQQIGPALYDEALRVVQSAH